MIITAVSLFALLLASPNGSHAEQNKPTAQQVTIPTPPSPTIPPDAMYALGQQSGQLTAISGRLEKIEDKLDSCREDITRIDAIGLFAALFVTVFWGPIAIEHWKRVFSKTPSN